MAYYKLRNAIVAAHKKLAKIPMANIMIRRWVGQGGELKKQKTFIRARKTGELVDKNGAIWLSKSAAMQFADQIDELNVGADHLRAKLDATWVKAYQQDDRSIEFMSSAGVISPKSIKTLPCHNCGIIIGPSGFVVGLRWYW